MIDHNPFSPPSQGPAGSTAGLGGKLPFFVMFVLLTALSVGPTIESGGSGEPGGRVSYTLESYGCPVFLERFAGSATGGRVLFKVPGVHFYWTSAVANVVWISGTSFSVSWVAARYDRRNRNFSRV